MIDKWCNQNKIFPHKQNIKLYLPLYFSIIQDFFFRLRDLDVPNMRFFSKLTKNLLFVFTGSVYFSSTGLSNQPPPNSYLQPLSLTQLIDKALSNNPQTKTVWWNARRQAAAQNVAESAYYPDISLRGKIAHGYDYQYTNGREVVYTDFEAGLSLSYMLLDFGFRDADTQAAIAALMSADWQFNWSMQKVIFEVLSSAYIYISAQEILTAREASLQDLQSTYEFVNDLFNCGLRSVSDLHAIRASISEAEMELILQKSAVSIAMGNLNTNLILPFDAPLFLHPLKDPSTDRPSISNIANMVRSAELQRADLQAKFADLNEKEAIRKRVGASYNPKVRLDADAGMQHYLHDKGKGLDYNVAINFSVPLYNGGKAEAMKQMAWADIQAASYDIDKTRLLIAKEIAIYNRQFEASQELFAVVVNYMQNAEDAFLGALERYKAGTISIFDLTIAQRHLAQARIRRADVKSSWYRDLAGLSFSMGVIANREKLCAE